MSLSKPSISIGGKGSQLSSLSVFSIANSLSLLKLDPSALTKKPSSSNPTNPPLSIPNYLSPQETKASIFITLNKLLTSPSSSSLFITSLIDTLNLPQESETHLVQCQHPNDTFCIDVIVIAISALIDHNASAISAVADAVAALSCESLQANVAKGFSSVVDSGDGLSDKDRVSVASDFRVFLNGSKFVGKFQSEFVSDIPIVHARLRNVVRTVRSATRVELNSREETDSRDVFTFLLPLALALQNLGGLSWGRAKLNIEALLNEELKANLLGLFNEGCPSVGEMERLVKCSQEGYYEKDYVRSLHEVYGLTEVVRRVVSWEAMSAFMLLEGAEWIEKVRANVPIMVDESGENAKGEKKKDKKKKVMGKGTSFLMQFVKDRLQLEKVEGDDSLVLLEKWVNGFLSLLDPKDPGFEGLLKKLKEIVDSNESRRLPKLPKGTRDFAKEQMAVREKAFAIITGVFKKHGAMALDTPVFEMRETLMGKYGEDSKLIYDLSDQGGELCSLRYDLTVPFARYVAMNGLTSFKRYQVAKVYRRDNPSKGRYREFYQCDFDIAGQYEKMGPDSEVIYILTELLDKLNIGDYEVKLNHRKLLDGMLDICGVPQEKFKTICSSIDKLDKQSFEQIKKEMVEEKGLNVETADKIGTFVKHRGRPLELLSELKQEGSKFLENSTSLSALNELEILFNALESAGRTDKLVFDLSLARGLDYYTGVIFEAVFKGETQVGSIAAGGRYDNLIGMFGTKQVPAIGVSLGIERVFTIMEQLQKDQNQAVRATETEILVSVLGDDLSLALKLASKCWDAELKAEYMVNKRVMKHIDRAKEFKIPYMVIVGERELSEGIVKLKDVNANKEETVPISKFVDELLARLRT